ncbi:putative sensor kinase silS [Candidatus Terasakiella magnetica]|nr:putative sensor kinase silS [Candidatus Terasakiella magnetica]
MMMMMMLRRKGQENRIGRRLMVLIIAFSSVLAMFATGLQLFLDYRQQRADIETQLDELKIFLPPISASVWTFNDEHIRLTLESLVKLTYIDSASITTPDGRSTWTAKDTESKRIIRRSYPLIHEERGEGKPIGTVEVVAGLDGVYGRLLSQALTILASNAVKTFLVAVFMYVVFSRMVTRRIEELARNAGSMMPEMLMSDVSVSDNTMAFPETGDEIDRLRWAFDNIGRQLRAAAHDLHDRNMVLEREVVERQRAESDLQQVVKELSRTNAELERFAYVAAHDLQEPVRGLVSFSQLLERKYLSSLGEDGKEYLSFIVEEAQRMSNLVRDLLDYSRVGAQGLAMAKIDCAEVLSGVLQALRLSIEQNHAEVIVGPMPRVMADGAQIHQLFFNLIGNALKYRRESVVPVIRITAEREELGWRFDVADNGIGIDSKYHDYVFEVFRRLHSGSSYSGTGIGLAICKRTVENHGGSIWLRSVPGEGTVFSFIIPDIITERLA